MSVVFGGVTQAASFGTAASMSTARDNHTATLLNNGKVLVSGGYAGGDAFSSVEVYDPASNTWSAAQSLRNPRWGHSATLLNNGKVLVVGGYTNTGNYLGVSSAEMYDPASNTWSAAGTLALQR
jgi:N-acetylneuraminic acid mutarotase